MWFKEEKLKQFIQETMQSYMQQKGLTLDSCLSAIKECFNVDNKGNIEISNSKLAVYINSTVTENADEQKLIEIKDIISDLYRVINAHSAEELDRLGMLELHEERIAKDLEKMRAELLDGIHAVMEYGERALKDLRKAVADAFNNQKREALMNARANLDDIMGEMWEGKKDQSYNGKAFGYAMTISNYAKKDFIADFCMIFFAPGFNSNNLKFFLDQHKGDKNLGEEEVSFILRTVLLNYNTKYEMKPWIKRCKDSSLRVYYTFRYDEERKKFENGDYDPTIPRDVFIAHNHKDEAVAWKLVHALEEKRYGLKCFFSPRNLRQSTNWERDLNKAMNNCKVFVFISTENSRNGDSGTYDEMDYVKKCDLQNAGKSESFPYEKIEDKDRMPRVEFLPYGETYDSSTPYGQKLRQFFGGLQYIERDIDKVCKRAFDIAKNGKWEQENGSPTPLVPILPSPAIPARTETHHTLAAMKPARAATTPSSAASNPAPKPKKVKYCVDCFNKKDNKLVECDETVKCCPQCGSKSFVMPQKPIKEDVLYCASCGTENTSDAKHCRNCSGTDLRAGTKGVVAHLINKNERKAEAHARFQTKLTDFIERRDEYVSKIVLLLFSLNFLFATLFPDVYFIPFFCLSAFFLALSVLIFKNTKPIARNAVHMFVWNLLYVVMGVLIKCNVLFSSQMMPSGLHCFVAVGMGAAGSMLLFLSGYRNYSEERMPLYLTAPCILLLALSPIWAGKESIIFYAHILFPILVGNVLNMVYSYVWRLDKAHKIGWTAYALFSVAALPFCFLAMLNLAA